MIIGMGSDLCNIERIAAALERHGDRFEQRGFPGLTGEAAGARFPARDPGEAVRGKEPIPKR